LAILLKIVNNPEGQPEDEPRQAIKKQAEASEKSLIIIEQRLVKRRKAYK